MKIKFDITERIRERFCKDCKIPIAIFKEPYFSDRLMLLNPYYDTLNKWTLFCKELSFYNTEQDYFEEYNRIKDDAIYFIKNHPSYLQFNNEDMNQYQIEHKNLPNKDIFKPSNDSHVFISIDMKKANFSSLHHYNPEIFGNAKTWEAFISKFTNNRHIRDSKYIRQVILGNCNPKRHITYEKYLMDKELSKILESVSDLKEKDIVFFSNDEIVFDISHMDNTQKENILNQLSNILDENMFRIESFILNRIYGTEGYIKSFEDGTFEFKCLDANIIPFVIRTLNNQVIQERDRIFIFNGKLAKLLDTPEISLEKEAIDYDER